MIRTKDTLDHWRTTTDRINSWKEFGTTKTYRSLKLQASSYTSLNRKRRKANSDERKLENYPTMEKRYYVVCKMSTTSLENDHWHVTTGQEMIEINKNFLVFRINKIQKSFLFILIDSSYSFRGSRWSNLGQTAQQNFNFQDHVKLPNAVQSNFKFFRIFVYQ